MKGYTQVEITGEEKTELSRLYKYWKGQLRRYKIMAAAPIEKSEFFTPEEKTFCFFLTNTVYHVDKQLIAQMDNEFIGVSLWRGGQVIHVGETERYTALEKIMDLIRVSEDNKLLLDDELCRHLYNILDS